MRTYLGKKFGSGPAYQIHVKTLPRHKDGIWRYKTISISVLRSQKVAKYFFLTCGQKHIKSATIVQSNGPWAARRPKWAQNEELPFTDFLFLSKCFFNMSKF